MRHGELRGFNQTLHRRLRQGKFNFALPVIQVREIRSGQRGEGETAAARAHQHAVALQLHGDFSAFRQPTANIKEFTCRNRGRARVVRLSQRNARDHFHFQICAGQRQRTVRDLKQQVSKNRQRRAAA